MDEQWDALAARAWLREWTKGQGIAWYELFASHGAIEIPAMALRLVRDALNAAGRAAAAPELSEEQYLDGATTIAEEIIKEYQRLEKEDYTHWHKRSIGRRVLAGINALLKSASTGRSVERYLEDLERGGNPG